MEFEIPNGEPPTKVELDRERHLLLTWADGRVSTFALESLRGNCPCAQYRGLRSQGKPVYNAQSAVPLTAIHAELVGNWGITIHWSDGHDTGIHAWAVLGVAPGGP